MGRLPAIRLAAATLVLATACAGTASDTRTGPANNDGLRVASFDFEESVLLAEMYALVVEDLGVPVVRLGVVGPREVLAPALELDLVDLVPEYLGTALHHAGAIETDPDTASALAELTDRLEPRGLTTLAAAPAQDKNVFVVTTQTAEREGFASISDLTGSAPALRFGGPAECVDRPLCLAGLESVYGLEFAAFVAQPSLVFTAEALRRSEIDVGLMFSTAATLDEEEFVILADDRRMQPAENVVPVIRADALARWGARVGRALDAVSAELSTLDLRDLNRRVAGGDTVEIVAREWLTGHRLIGGG